MRARTGSAFEVAPDVFGELLDRLVATCRLFAHRHQHDVVEVAAQPPPQPLGLSLARPAHGLGREPLARRAVSASLDVERCD